MGSLRLPQSGDVSKRRSSEAAAVTQGERQGPWGHRASKVGSGRVGRRVSDLSAQLRVRAGRVHV